MRKIKILKFLFIILVNYSILELISFLISYFFNFTLKDTSFVIGLLVFIIELCLNISGNPMGLSLQSLGNINSQYVSNVDLNAIKHENNDNPQISVKNLINSTLFFSSILILITAYFL